LKISAKAARSPVRSTTVAMISQTWSDSQVAYQDMGVHPRAATAAST
jgi:hypothetical protein